MSVTSSGQAGSKNKSSSSSSPAFVAIGGLVTFTVGERVGDKVGLFVGPWVGDLVGTSVGDEVGDILLEGESVGLELG